MIYLFGDSFLNDVNRPEWCFIELLKQDFGTQEKNCSLIGSSIDYAIEQVDQHREQFQDQDILLITLTVEQKLTFFSDRPTLSHPVWNRPFFDHVPCTPEEKNAMRSFYRHLYNPGIQKIHVLNFLHMLDTLTAQKNLHTIVLNSVPHSFDSQVTAERFPHLHIALGYLADAGMAEISNQSMLRAFEIKNWFNDPRPQHFSEPNHRHLHTALANAIRSNTVIELNKIFEKDIFGPVEYAKYRQTCSTLDWEFSRHSSTDRTKHS